MTSELLKSLIDESVQRALEKSKLSEEYYKNLNKHTQCTKCYDKITSDKYKKDRSICRKCYSIYMLEYNSNRRGEYIKLDSSRKQDVSSKTDCSNNFDSSNKQESSRKQVRSRKQDSSNKEDITNKQVRKKVSSRKSDSVINRECSNTEDLSINNIIDCDPNLLCDNLREISSKPDMKENDYTMTKMILDELLRTKCIPRKQYNAMCKQRGLI